MDPNAVIARRPAQRGQCARIEFGRNLTRRPVLIGIDQDRHFGREDHVGIAALRFADRFDDRRDIGVGIDAARYLQDGDTHRLCLTADARMSITASHVGLGPSNG